jgi:hypothetical protein
MFNNWVLLWTDAEVDAAWDGREKTRNRKPYDRIKARSR